MKVLQRVVGVCESTDSSAACREEVVETLYPVLKKEVNSENFEFALVRISVDLRGVRDDIRNLADGSARYDGHYRVDRVLSRWTVEDGKVAGAGEPGIGEREP